ncbi:MAG TPA: AhpC/TSA family protein, partial [Mangrovimonas sp.]|nr:AhpC/TSA family protein [Mangrovimonas sp.]
ASWCAPCRKENKVILDPLWKAYHDKGLQIIGYGLESDEQSWKAAIQKDQALWLQTSHLEGDEAPLCSS